MKKLFVIALAATLVVMFTVPATAKVTHKFNGYWRTRFFTYDNTDFIDEGRHVAEIDTRTRIKYTAKIHENLQFVNYFEMDTRWGGTSYGDRGADAIAVEVKNTYAKFNFANLEWTIGTQGFKDPSGGFIYSSDMTGMKINYRADNYVFGFWWWRAWEGERNSGNNGEDFDVFTAVLNYKSGNHRIAPFIVYMYTNDGGGYPASVGDPYEIYATAGEEQEVWFLGINYGLKAGNTDFMLNFIYETGDANDNADIDAWVFDVRSDTNFGNWGLKARFMYVSGDDDVTDNDVEGWYIPGGDMHSKSDYAEYWGGGSFDSRIPSYSQGKDVTDIMAFGPTVYFKPNKAWQIDIGLWHLRYAEDGATSEQVLYGTSGDDKEIGNELDILVTWKMMKNFKVYGSFAYLFIGDAIEDTLAGADDEDSWEAYLQMELKY
jgi:hypothetical protein